MAGLCGTDYAIWSGDRTVRYPLVLGHEFVGHVDAIGEGVSRVGVGDRVAIEPNYSCGACPLCREGNRNLCLSRTAVGIDVDGCFAEIARVPERCCWPAPPGVADEDLLMTEPLAVVVRAVARAGVRPGESAAVVGGRTLGLLAAQVLRSLALPPKYFRLVIVEIETMGIRSLGVALVASIFTGMVFALQSAVNMARFGAENYVGPLTALAILRELGPVLTAILVGGKVASGITAELGSMRVTEQIDALRTLGVNFIKRLIVPRVLAALLVFPLLTILSDVLGVLGGMVIMFFERGTDMWAYWNTTTYWVVPRDFLMGVGKSFFFGGIVALIGCYNGLSTSGGTEGLGRATTATVVHCTMGVIISDFFLTKLMFMIFW